MQPKLKLVKAKFLTQKYVKNFDFTSFRRYLWQSDCQLRTMKINKQELKNFRQFAKVQNKKETKCFGDNLYVTKVQVNL